jgi:hypothetical protein
VKERLLTQRSQRRRKQKAESRRQKAEGRRQKAEGRRQRERGNSRFLVVRRADFSE